MRIVVVGAGGVGGYFGAQLAAHGQDVVFVARGDHLEAIRSDGLRVESEHAPVHLADATVTDSIGSVDSADLVIVAVKLWDTEDVARQLAPLVASGAAVMSLQNGVQKDDDLRRHLPPESILGGACYISAAIERPGVVRHNGTLARIVFGEYDGSASARSRAIEGVLTGAGIETELSLDIAGVLWRKFVFLVGLSSVTSVTRQPIGVVRRVPETRRLLREVMAEVVAVGRARGVDLAEDYADQQLDFCDGLPEQMSSSMAYDLAHGHRLELPWLGGGVVTMAAEAGVSVPVNETLAAALAPYVAGAPG
jgi:2-dehydropantoate 2-reductase